MPPRPHSRILFNVLIALETALWGVEREICAFDVAVRTDEENVPVDIVVVRGEPIFESNTAEVVINPALVVELLPLEAAGYDHAGKFSQCLCIESLMDYLLIAQDRPRVEQYACQSYGLWLPPIIVTELDATIEMASVGCTLSLADVYKLVAF